MNRPGQRNYSAIRISSHAVERFIERFGVPEDFAEQTLRRVLSRARRLGRNSRNGAIAVLTLHENRVLIAILQDETCLTIVTWDQFEPKLREFGRSRVPRKWGRFLSRLNQTPRTDNPDSPESGNRESP